MTQAETIFARVLASLEDVDADLYDFAKRFKRPLVEAITVELNKATRKSTARARAGGAGFRIDVAAMPLDEALRELPRLVRDLASNTHFEGQRMIDDGIGFNGADFPAMRDYLKIAETTGDSMPLVYHLAAAETLIKYGESQLGGVDVPLRLVDAIRSEARRQGIDVSNPKLTDPTRSKERVEGGGSFTWSPQDGLVLKFRGDYRAFQRHYGLQSSTRLKKLADGSWGLSVAPGSEQLVVGGLADGGMTGLSAAVQAALPAWQAVYGKEEDRRGGMAVDPNAGRESGLAWRKDGRDMLVDLPRDMALAASTALKLNRFDEAQPSGGKIYWRVVPIEKLRPLAAFVGGRFGEILNELADYHERTGEPEPSVDETARSWAMHLAQRFAYQMKQPPPPLDTIAQKLLLERTRLEGIVPGTMAANLGAYGSWELVTRGNVEYLRISGGREINDAAAAVRGARAQRDDRGWATYASVKVIPAIARNLDEIGNFPLATSLRMAFMVDDVQGAAGGECAVLEAMSQAKSLDDVSVPAVRRGAQQVVESIRMPPGRALRPYQQVGVAFLVAAHWRALIGDPPGVGKTLQAIASMLYAPSKTLPALVVVPASAVGNWEAEINTWSSGIMRPVPVYEKSGFPAIVGAHDVVIVSWGMITRIVDSAIGRKFKTLVLDESQKAKHGTSARSQAVLEISKHTPNALLLSGTALENRPADLWHQLHILDPAQFPTLKDFMKRIDAQTRLVRLPGGRVLELDDDRSATNLEELRDLLRCVMVRRRKEDVLGDLPPKIRVPVIANLTAKERAIYDDAKDKIEVALDNSRRDKALTIAAELVLRGAPMDDAIRQARDETTADSSIVLAQLGELRRITAALKVPYATQWIEDWLETTDDPLVVAYEHKATLQVMEDALDKAKVAYTVINGEVGARERTQRIADFQAGKYKVMFLSRAGQEAVTLTRAPAMLFVERQWVPAWEEQMEDRLHRKDAIMEDRIARGTQSSLNIYYLTAPGTIDEMMAAQISAKREVVSLVMGLSDVERGESAAVDPNKSVLAAVAARIVKNLDRAPPITAAEVRKRMKELT